MTEKNEMGSADFFDEIQEKVEQEMFLDGALSGEEDAVALKPRAAPPEEKPGVSADMDDIEDPDLFEGDLDEALFDEIDAVQSGGKPSDAFLDTEQAPRSHAASGSTVDMAADAIGDDLTDLREDDLMLGELINSEMVEPRQTGRAPAEQGATVQGGEDVLGQKRDVMDTRTLGDLYAAQGHYAKAVTIYEKLATASPGDRKLLERLGELRLQAARDSVEPVPQDKPLSSGSEREWHRDPQMVLVKRLEAWLDHIQGEKERRCSQSS